MERIALRKPREYFDTTAHPSHVTFDDGKAIKRNFPWMHYAETRWLYHELDILRVEIGDWIVVIRGHNLAPLFVAIEEHTLLRLRAQPELAKDRERQIDSFAVEIRFERPLPGNLPVPKKPPTQLALGLDQNRSAE